MIDNLRDATDCAGRGVVIDLEAYREARRCEAAGIKKITMTPEHWATVEEYGRRRDAAIKGWARRRERLRAEARQLA